MKSPHVDRDVIPIWRTTKEASTSAEMRTTNSPKIEDEQPLTSDRLMQEFKNSKSLGVAADLLNIAWLEKNSKALRISAEFIVDDPNATPDIQRLSRIVLGLSIDTPNAPPRHPIGILRDKLKLDSGNPLAWVDLSREYAILNNPIKADRAMQAALYYANSHRWVCRAAARLYVHFDDPAKAQRVLSKNPNTRNDPWLLATDLAVSRLAERPLKNWGQAKKIVESNINQLHLSELASSIGTSEIIGGAEKKAKSYFKQALISPNSNSLAQVKWADRLFHLGFARQIHHSLDKVSSAYETLHWECYERKEMLEAVKHAQKWLDEEPYSAKPAQAVTYIGSVINDLDLIYRTADLALDRNPGDITLRLNFIYAKICIYGVRSNDEKAISLRDFRFLKNVAGDKDKISAAHALANLGLMHYRGGYSSEGKRYYDHARNYYEKNRDDAMLYLLLNHHREVLISGDPWFEELDKELTERVRKSRTIATPAAEFYIERIQELKNAPGSWAEKLSKPFAVSSTTTSEIKTIEKIPSKNISQKFWLPPEMANLHDLGFLQIPTLKKQK